MKIPISFIQSEQTYPLCEYHVKSLITEIGRVGLLLPITVTGILDPKSGQISYKVLAGHTRLEACRRLKHTEIEVNTVIEPAFGEPL